MSISKNPQSLPYDPNALPRELKRHYISASEGDITAMLDTIGLKKLDDLFSHIAEDISFGDSFHLPEEISYEELQRTLLEASAKNRLCESFIGDGLPDYEVQPIIHFVSSLRNLTTAYTPYQPERSQGTLMAHWVYQCVMGMLTGFEAINSSLYDRATTLYEAIITSIRLKRNTDTTIVPEALFPGDIEVIETLATNTDTKIIKIPLDSQTGLISLSTLRETAEKTGSRLASIVFPQVNSLGLLEDVDALADFCREIKVKSIAVIDPMHLGTGGLKPPVDFGQEGADIIVGEGQHTAIGPNFGGPGLGVFGVRYNEKVKNDIRQTPGRFVGKATDLQGRDCRVMVLSTREQHIRQEKATSNICSNQAFLATLAGAAILARGEKGMSEAAVLAYKKAHEAAIALSCFPGVEIAFPNAYFFNEITFSVPVNVDMLIKKGRQEGLHIGVNISDRIKGNLNLLKVSFTDKKSDFSQLIRFFEKQFGAQEEVDLSKKEWASIPKKDLRQIPVGLPQIPIKEIEQYYRKLNSVNVSPDQGCYPLGSCTMKYNPFINDWAASLKGFAAAHPQAPTEDVQGSLEVLYETQEWFKKITGLSGLTTQPVAGAQGELVGIKMFQAYHRDRGENRDIMLIPKSAHGTNFATASMAGFDIKDNIVRLEANEKGQIDQMDLDQKLAEYGPRVCGIMITNPNTSGLFETQFKQIAEKVHHVGGLVYMDGANMNAIAGWVNLGLMGVDAVHNNLHKTWTIPHGGGGPGDAIVAVSEKLLDYLPGWQIVKKEGLYVPEKPQKSIGSFHRHWGNFAHKVRCYTYLLRLGKEGVRRITAVSVLAARYLFEQLKKDQPSLPFGAEGEPRMHEFILTLKEEEFAALQKVGIAQNGAIPRLGKLFLDFGFHAPTVAWPEAFGFMIEPTESYTKAELDRFAESVQTILHFIRKKPETLVDAPRFTPVDRIDDVSANRQLCVFEKIESLPPINDNRFSPEEMLEMPVESIARKIIEDVEQRSSKVNV